MKFKDVMRNVNRGKILPTYLLIGDDYFLQNFLLNHISTIYFKDAQREKVYLSTDELNGKKIIEIISNVDLFASKKIFIIKSPHKLKGKFSNDLLEICKNPPGHNILFLIEDEWNNRSAFIKKLKHYTDPVDVQTPYYNDMKKWARYLVRERGKSIEDSCVEYIVNAYGDSLANLNNELEKICLMVGEKRDINKNDIKSSQGWVRDRKRWEFFLALIDKNYKKSLILGKNIINRNETMLSLLYPLTMIFQELLYCKMKKGTLISQSSYIPIPPSVKKKIPESAIRFEKKQIVRALELLGKIDKRQKEAYASDETELIQFIACVLG